MRLVKVSAPQGKGQNVAEVAFSVGIEKVSIRTEEVHKKDGESEIQDAVDISTSTPKCKNFIDSLLKSDFYNRENFSIAIRQPRSIISGESLRELTKPLVEPATDILEELWQFSHINYGFIGRIFISAGLLSYGLIEQKILLIIAGLLFLPLLPLMLAISFGIKTKNWRLAGQGALAFLTVTALLFLGGAAIATVSNPPVKYDDFNSLPISILISVAVGVAAVLANIDDVGRRELIGLAATAQIAITPVWFGICSVLGFPNTVSSSEITSRGATFFLNVLTIIIVTLVLYIATNAANNSLEKVNSE